MDKIVLTGLEFHARHGVFEAESNLGARFVIDVELSLLLSGRDLLEETVDYAAVYALVQQRVTERRFLLIEALACDLAAELLTAHPTVAEVRVRVHKPHAPLPGIVRDVYAEVTRHRRDP